MQQFSVVLNQLIGMGVMLAVGAVCVRTKLLNEESLQGICRLILNVGIPMLVFSNAISGTTRADLFASAAIIGITILLYALLIASMWQNCCVCPANAAACSKALSSSATQDSSACRWFWHCSRNMAHCISR